MALNVTPVNRNLQTRVTFMCLEFEDLFVVLGVAALTNVAGHFVSGEIGGIPMSIVVQYGVPLSPSFGLLMLFKYGRPRGYVRDLALWYLKAACLLCRRQRPRNDRRLHQGGVIVPLTVEQHEKKLQEPALCEQLAVRDYLDNVVVRTNGSFVAGFRQRQGRRPDRPDFFELQRRPAARGLPGLHSQVPRARLHRRPDALGRLTPAGLGMSCLIPLIKAGFVDWIVSTGANLYHDTHYAPRPSAHQSRPNLDDFALRRT